jgi:hypothetical protein
LWRLLESDRAFQHLSTTPLFRQGAHSATTASPVGIGCGIPRQLKVHHVGQVPNRGVDTGFVTLEILFRALSS